MFVDSAKIYVRSGSGGNGIIHWRREKFVPKGGPDGGNGGKGGDVVIRAEKQLTTLLDFRYKKRYIAQNGEHGEGSNREGRSGQDTLIKVPCGTIIRNAQTGDLIGDLVEHGTQIVLARGGRGGKGNSEFATSTNQAPRICTPGEEGKELNAELELKLLADVGLVGFPNAGKSTLISKISAAKPKIADYPFTTLVPNLGMVYFQEGKSFVVADIPGLIEGAHEGKGLGTQFLRHIERTKILAYLIECSSDDPKREFLTLRNELESFNHSLPKKPSLVVVTKLDIADAPLRKKLGSLKFRRGVPVFFISSVSGENLDGLIAGMWKLLEKADRNSRN
ncbi:MAG TPA: GTPase ObgE [Bacteroidota bacterium]|nr:GTPase ObgE [Bacteroidota bacterium]